MNRHAHLLFGALILACSPQEPNDDPEQARIEEACVDWCEVAVPCSEYYAPQQNFDDIASCEEACVLYVDRVRDERPASCLEVILEDRECSAALTCEEFVAYEELSFSEPPSVVPVPCAEEVSAKLDGCYL